MNTAIKEVDGLNMKRAYGYATKYKKSVHAKCVLYSRSFWGYGMLFRLRYTTCLEGMLSRLQNDTSISYIRDFLYSVAYP